VSQVSRFPGNYICAEAHSLNPFASVSFSSPSVLRSSPFDRKNNLILHRAWGFLEPNLGAGRSATGQSQPEQEPADDTEPPKQLRDERLVKAFAEGKSDISDELVFPSEAGTPIEMNNFSERVFKPLLSRAGLRKIRFHDLRHSYGSLLIQTGASLAYVRDQMGHSSIQVTVDIYGHLIPGANVAYVDKLDGQTIPQQSATQPQQRARLESDGFKEVLGNEWLGGRDSNPDTQIQSLISPPDSKANQQLRSAKRGRVRQNPQRRRKKSGPPVPPR